MSCFRRAKPPVRGCHPNQRGLPYRKRDGCRSWPPLPADQAGYRESAGIGNKCRSRDGDEVESWAPPLLARCCPSGYRRQVQISVPFALLDDAVGEVRTKQLMLKTSAESMFESCEVSETRNPSLDGASRKDPGAARYPGWSRTARSSPVDAPQRHGSCGMSCPMQR